MRHFNLSQLKQRRRQLRSRSTPSESLLWNQLRNNQLGCKFKRQYSVDGYVMDFYSPSQKLGIELEGGIHLKNSQQKYDAYRFNYLKEFGIHIIRFSNQLVDNNITSVVSQIKNIIGSLSLPRRGIKGEV